MEEEDDAVIEIREYLDVENDSKVVKTELVDISQELELIKKFTKMHEAKTNNNIEQKQNSFGECEGDLRAIVSKATDDDNEFIRDLALLSESGSKDAGIGEGEDIIAVLDKLQSASDKRTKKTSSSSQSGWKKGFLS